MWLPSLAPRFVRLRVDTGRSLPEQVSRSSPREGLRSWRIPLRGPRDEYLPVRQWAGRETEMRRLVSWTRKVSKGLLVGHACVACAMVRFIFTWLSD